MEVLDGDDGEITFDNSGDSVSTVTAPRQEWSITYAGLALSHHGS